MSVQTIKRLPEWLRRNLPESSAVLTHEILETYSLNTVCESARCPNRSECYSRKTATFMILGDHCTRRCGFCAVETGKPLPVEPDEPSRVAQAALELGLHYVVITSVARDDLKDEGASHFACTIEAVRSAIPGVQIEVLTPDFHGRRELLEKVVRARPDVFNHNIETIRRLQRSVRPQANYERSLRVLKMVKEIAAESVTKSGIMLGLGEKDEEIFETAEDLLRSGCDLLTLGQYLAPGPEYFPVQDFVEPLRFDSLRSSLKAMGFREVFAGPYVRSSYHAGEVFNQK